MIIRKTITVITKSEIPKKIIKSENGCVIRNWSVQIVGLNEEDRQFVNMEYCNSVKFILHQSFENPEKEFKTMPYKVNEKGWGEFDIGIIFGFGDFYPQITLLHSLHFRNKCYRMDYDLEFELDDSIDNSKFIKLLDHDTILDPQLDPYYVSKKTSRKRKSSKISTSNITQTESNMIEPDYDNYPSHSPQNNNNIPLQKNTTTSTVEEVLKTPSQLEENNTQLIETNIDQVKVEDEQTNEIEYVQSRKLHKTNNNETYKVTEMEYSFNIVQITQRINNLDFENLDNKQCYKLYQIIDIVESFETGAAVKNKDGSEFAFDLTIIPIYSLIKIHRLLNELEGINNTITGIIG